jgi:hypothetical protein
MHLLRLTSMLTLLGVGTDYAQPRAAEATAERAIVLLVARAQSAGNAVFFSARSAQVTIGMPTFGVGGCVAELSTVQYSKTPTAQQRAAVEAARREFCRRNTTMSTFPPATVAAVRAALAALPAHPPTDRCGANPVVAVTRVGFDSMQTVAIAGYQFSVGARPYPGCGYAQSGGLVFLRQRDGSWMQIGTLPGAVT